MKRLFYINTLVLALFLLGGCTEEMGNSTDEGVEVQLSASVETRATLDDTWEDGDQVGVYGFVDGAAQVSNAMYTVTPSNGALTPSNGKANFLIPEGGSADIYAYSPYSSGKVSDTTYKVDLTDQSTPQKVQASDLMWAKAENQTDRICSLNFEHKLIRLDINLTAVGDVTSLRDFEMTLEGIGVKGNFDLKTGQFSNMEPGSIKLNPIFMSQNDASARVTVLFYDLKKVPRLWLRGKRGGLNSAYDFSTVSETIMNGCTSLKVMVDVGHKEPPPEPDPFGIQYVKIDKGTFIMGSPEGEWGRDKETDWVQHKVTLTKDFYISKKEITVAQYVQYLNYLSKACLENSYTIRMGKFDLVYKLYYANAQRQAVIVLINYSYGNDLLVWEEPEQNHYIFRVKPGCENLPIAGVTWDGAQAYAKWVGGSLPTEAQWEYACRERSTYAYPFNPNNLGEYAVYEGNSNGRTSNVGSSKQPSLLYGLYDMIGNVYEWCLDGYIKDARKNTADATDPVIRGERPVPEGGFIFGGELGKVVRGGSYKTSAEWCRSASAWHEDWVACSWDIGFRVVRSTKP